jgi:hypothetical protein
MTICSIKKSQTFFYRFFSLVFFSLVATYELFFFKGRHRAKQSIKLLLLLLWEQVAEVRSNHAYQMKEDTPVMN